MVAGPARGRCRRAASLPRAFAMPCAHRVESGRCARRPSRPTCSARSATSQFVTPDSPLRRTAAEAADPLNNPRLQRDKERESRAPSRIGQIPTYGLPAANGAATSGYDSLNRKRKKPKYYPGQARPKPPPGPGSPPRPAVASNVPLRLSIPPSDPPTRRRCRRRWRARVPGQPPRKRLKIDDDPFGAVGDYAGSFLVKSAVEFSGGYDTNPGRLNVPQGSPFYVVAPELLVVSDWERHALVADLRGSFTGYGRNLPPNADGTPLPAPLDVDRPNFIGHIDGRLDVTRDTRLLGQARLLVATDNPGSPNMQAGLAKYPLYATYGGTFGFDQNFNRLQVSGGATVDRTDYQWSKLTDGTSTTNDDRNFYQYGGVGRVSYELTPAVKPFVEVARRQPRARPLSRSQRLRARFQRRLRQGRHLVRVLPHPVRRNLRRLRRARLRRSAPQPPGGPAHHGLADLAGDAADHGQILFRHPARRDHAARHLRRAGAHLHLRGRSRFSPLADRRSANSPTARSTIRATTAAPTRSTPCPATSSTS